MTSGMFPCEQASQEETVGGSIGLTLLFTLVGGSFEHQLI